jgi:hypothetical protein
MCKLTSMTGHWKVSGSDVCKSMPGPDPIRSLIFDNVISGSLRWMWWREPLLRFQFAIRLGPVKHHPSFSRQKCHSNTYYRIHRRHSRRYPRFLRHASAGVTIMPNSINFTETGQQVSVQLTAVSNAPLTSAPVPLTITGVAGSITHSITLYILVAPER